MSERQRRNLGEDEIQPSGLFHLYVMCLTQRLRNHDFAIQLAILIGIFSGQGENPVYYAFLYYRVR